MTDVFVVRVWSAADAGVEANSFCGVVEHVGSGSSVPFRSDEELLALLRGASEESPAAAAAAHPGRARTSSR